MSESTQLAAFLGGALPAHIQDSDGARLNKEATGGVGGESINRISLKQSRFRLIVGGEQVKVVDEPHLDVVIVRSNPGASKAFYTKKYDPNAEDQSPECFSSNGVVPDADAESPQCATCAECPHNQWGSKISEMSGKKVKACSDMKRIAIVPHNNPAAPMFQVAIPAASMKVFGNYIRQLNQITPAIPYNAVVTRLKFDAMSDYPRLEFEPVRWLSASEYATVKERYDSEEAKHIATVVNVPVDAPTQPKAAKGPSSDPAPETDKWAAEEAAQAEADAAAKAKVEAEMAARRAKAKAEREAAEKAAAERAAAELAEENAKLAAAEAKRKAAEAAKSEEDPETAAAKAAALDAVAGWGGGATETVAREAKPDLAASKAPPVQREGQQNATVVNDGDVDLSSVFGEGWDD